MNYVVVITEIHVDTDVIGPFDSRAAAWAERDTQSASRPRSFATVVGLVDPTLA